MMKGGLWYSDTNDQLWSTFTLQPTPEDIATTHFFSQFTTAGGHWTFMRDFARELHMEPVLELALRACGMASLDNIQGVVMGKQYSRSWYGDALGLLNKALRDPKQCRADSTLIAVAMLGYYENLTCDSQASIRSWKAHIDGAKQLLKLRGKKQFQTVAGRNLFREVRAQVMIRAVWDDLDTPAWIQEYEEELQNNYPEPEMFPATQFLSLTMEFASIRSQMRLGSISDAAAMGQLTQLEMKMISWSLDTMENRLWRYTDLEVEESPHVWNGIVHSYSGHPVPSMWNTYRSIRILLTRTQENLCYRLQLRDEQLKAQQAYFRSVRRQMTDEICGAIPSQLGNAFPAYNSPCPTITGYNSIWPLFFAGSCALERVPSPTQGNVVSSGTNRNGSAAAAQASWIVGRMDYISNCLGIKWAYGVAAMLRGDFRVQQDVTTADAVSDKLKSNYRNYQEKPELCFEDPNEETPNEAGLEEIAAKMAHLSGTHSSQLPISLA